MFCKAHPKSCLTNIQATSWQGWKCALLGVWGNPTMGPFHGWKWSISTTFQADGLHVLVLSKGALSYQHFQTLYKEITMKAQSIRAKILDPLSLGWVWFYNLS